MRLKTIKNLILPAIAAGLFITSPVSAQHENDLMFGVVSGRAGIMEPDNFEVPKIMYFSSGIQAYIRDQGLDFELNPQTWNYYIRAMRWQQTYITPGLVGGNRFGGSNPGFITLNWDNPHLHVPFIAPAPGVYLLKFRVMDAILANGTPIPNSEELTMMWVAGSNFAQLPLHEIRNLPDTPLGSPSNGFAGVDLRNLVVTSASGQFQGGFYVQTADRTGGLFVQSGQSFQPGDRLSILQGHLRTVGAERAIQAVNITPGLAGQGANPLFMKASLVGGPPTGKYTPGIKDALGISNTGLLVKVAGKIIHSGGRVFVNDGSQFPDGQTGLEIDVSGLSIPVSLPANNQFAVVTGISGIHQHGSGFVPVIRPRAASDIVIP